jgi:hypothetical protein
VNFDALAEGDRVEFEIDRSPKGPRAKNIDLLEPVSDQTQSAAAPGGMAETDRKPVEDAEAPIKTRRGAPSHRGRSSAGFRPRR